MGTPQMENYFYEWWQESDDCGLSVLTGTPTRCTAFKTKTLMHLYSTRVVIVLYIGMYLYTEFLVSMCSVLCLLWNIMYVLSH